MLEELEESFHFAAHFRDGFGDGVEAVEDLPGDGFVFFCEAGDAEFEFRVFVAGDVFGVFDDGEWGGRDEGVRFEAGAFFFGSFFSRGFVDFPSGSPCRAEDGDDECGDGGDGGDGYVAIRGGIGKEWWEHGR